MVTHHGDDQVNHKEVTENDVGCMHGPHEGRAIEVECKIAQRGVEVFQRMVNHILVLPLHLVPVL